MVFVKPSFNTVWASGGEKVAPDVAKISQGWVVEIPPHQYENWIVNRQDQMLAHINQYGVAEWDSSTEYQANKSYVQGVTTGNVYRALTTNTGINPETDVNNNWTIAFERSGLSLLKSQNLADVPDKAAARANLGIATTTDYDARYLLKSSNFADVPNKSSARGNLEVYSRQEVMSLLDQRLPAGEISFFPTTIPPEGWLVCAGQALDRTTYSRLFARIGTRYGAGNGTTTFNIPDLRGEFIRCDDQGRGVDSGRTVGTFQDSTKIPFMSVAASSENSAILVTPSAQVVPLNGTAFLGSGTEGNYLTPISPYFSTPLTKTGGVTPIGMIGTRPRNISLLACIRF